MTSAGVPAATTSPPCSPAPGPMSTTKSAAADGVLVVLHDHHGVAQVAQALQRGDEPLVVALVQPDGGLVQNVEHAHEPGADLGGQPDALGLAAGERGRGPLQREVVQAHVHQEAQPRA